MVNSRRKGNRAEREVKNQLRAWWGGDWKRQTMGIPGSDLVPPPDFPFSVEIKHWKRTKHKHLFNPTAEVLGFWEQAVTQAVIEAKKPMLIIKVEGTWYTVVLGATTATSLVPCLRAVWGKAVTIAPLADFIGYLKGVYGRSP